MYPYGQGLPEKYRVKPRRIAISRAEGACGVALTAFCSAPATRGELNPSPVKFLPIATARREPCDTRGKRGTLRRWCLPMLERLARSPRDLRPVKRGRTRARRRLPIGRGEERKLARLRRSRGRAIHEAASSKKSEGAVFAYSSPCPSQLGRASR